MRVAIAAVSFAALAYVSGCQNAGAVAAGGTTIKPAAESGSVVTHVRFYGRNHGNYVVKCYRQLVIGRYVCRRYYRL